MSNNSRPTRISGLESVTACGEQRCGEQVKVISKRTPLKWDEAAAGRTTRFASRKLKLFW